MAESYRREFDELSALAEKQLQHPEGRLPRYQRLFRIWRYPSFEPYVSTMIFAPVQPHAKFDLPLVVEVKWDRPFDVMRFHDPMKGLAHGFLPAPTMSVKEGELLPDELALRIANLEKLQVPLVLDRTVGVDGEHSGFETFGCGSAVRITWWSIMPPAWQPIVEWSKEMQEFLSAALERKSPAINAI